MRFADALGQAGLALAAIALLMSLPPLARLPRRWRATLALVAGVVLLWPVGELSLIGYVRGVSGDLSVTAVVLAALGLWRRLAPVPSKVAEATGAGLGAIVLLAILFYPPALGLGGIDPYRWGYGDPGFVAAVALAGLAAWHRRENVLAAGVGLALLAWGAHAGESANLWDYLIDPLLSLYALGACARRLLERRITVPPTA